MSRRDTRRGRAGAALRRRRCRPPCPSSRTSARRSAPPPRSSRWVCSRRPWRSSAWPRSGCAGCARSRPNPMGVPELSAATEHAESAGYALRVAQEQLSGVPGRDRAGRRRRARRPARAAARPAPRRAAGSAGPTTAAPEPTEQVRMRRWWSVRVAELTGGREGGADEPDERLDRLPGAAAPGGPAASAPATGTGCAASCAGRTPTWASGWPRSPRRCCASWPVSCSATRPAPTTWPGCAASWTAGSATCCPACRHRCWTPC